MTDIYSTITYTHVLVKK